MINTKTNLFASLFLFSLLALFDVLIGGESQVEYNILFTFINYQSYKIVDLVKHIENNSKDS